MIVDSPMLQSTVKAGDNVVEPPPIFKVAGMTGDTVD
jgi:hypothetical protein